MGDEAQLTREEREAMLKDLEEMTSSPPGCKFIDGPEWTVARGLRLLRMADRLEKELAASRALSGRELAEYGARVEEFAARLAAMEDSLNRLSRAGGGPADELCGTSSLRQIDSSELGERFLDGWLFNPVDREVTPGGATRMKPKRLTTDKMNECAMTVCRLADTIQLYEQTRELRERVKVFEAAVWFPRLQAVVNGTDARGMSGACRDVKVMTWCCAGRCLIQLTRGDATLTLITADDEKPWSRDNAHVACHMGPMGVQHVDAEYVDALKLIHTATRYGAEMTLTRDDAVTIG